MLRKKPTERTGGKVAPRWAKTTEQSPEAVFDEAVDAVQRLLRSGRIDQESADALTKFLLAGYISYTIHQEVGELTEYILESFSQTEIEKNG